MSCTDADLKRLKDTFAKPEYHQDISQDIASWILNKQETLLARLEAAEEGFLWAYEHGNMTTLTRFMEVWKKAAGK